MADDKGLKSVAGSEQRYYSMPKVNRIFALSSVIMLATFIAMFVNDYDREWKHYQREFRKLEIAKTRAKFSEETAHLADSTVYRDAVDNLAKVQADIEMKARQIMAAEKIAAELKIRNNKDVQLLGFAKSEYDPLRYDYEKAVVSGKDVDKAKTKLDDKFTDMEQKRVASEASTLLLAAADSQVAAYGAERKKMEADLSTLSKKADILERKLKTIDPDEMSFMNRMGNQIRDLPLLDFLNPSYKIEQVVVKDVTDNLNFMRVPTVDRCQTCHQGLLKPAFAGDSQPYRTHPRLDLFLSSGSPHPLENFGCGSCHNGRGRGTDFLGTVHVPSSASQGEQWKTGYGWHPLHNWETPMLPLKYVEASCLKCHTGATEIRGADKLNLGLQLIEKAGCYGCHDIARYQGRSKPGPSLTHLASKVTKDWAYRWILNPKAFRRNAWMPRFFDQSNNNDPVSMARSRQEIHAIVTYLFNHSESYAMTPIPAGGVSARGEEMVAAVGCMGCHTVSAFNRADVNANLLRRMQGPELTGLATKTSSQWVYNWIRNPQSYHPGSRMPNLRLSDAEAADVAAYLTQGGHSVNDAFMGTSVPAVNPKVVDDIVVDFLRGSKTEVEAKAEARRMKLDEKLDYAGKKLIGTYGCFGCHDIAGFEKAKSIGTDLTEEASKPISKLDFGFMHDIEHVNYAFFGQKLHDPRIFDTHTVKRPLDKLRMPNFDFGDTEVDAIVTALMGFVKPNVLASKVMPPTPRNLSIEAGQRVIREYNCQGCHIIEGRGGAIQPMVEQWLINHQGKDTGDAEAVFKNLSPPNLIGEGQKVQTQWLFQFIRSPQPIRPWLKVRMPTFAFSSEQINSLITYFSALDNAAFPFVDHMEPNMTPDRIAAAKALFGKENFSCGSCHVVGAALPGGTADNWAPNFALAKNRLRPEWIIKWIKDPGANLPGTKMPQFISSDNPGPASILGGDSEQQIRVLRDYLLTIQ